MARIRSVHPGMASDESYMSMSMAARAAWPLLWTECDDQGVFEWKPMVLKARIFPADSLDFSLILAEWESLNCIKKFTAMGKSYGMVRNFRKYQRPKKPNSVHPINTEWGEYVGVSSPPVPHQFPTSTEKPFQMEDGGDKMEDIKVKKEDTSYLVQARETWNDLANEVSIPKVQNLSQARLSKLKLRLAEIGGIGGWTAMLEIIRGSPHLLGKNDSGWTATFDWVMEPKNLTKIMEGNYLERVKEKPSSNAESAATVVGSIQQRIAEIEALGSGSITSAEAGKIVSRLREGAA